MGIFDGLEALGFGEMEGLELFPSEEVKKKQSKPVSAESPLDYLYVKDTECPVCLRFFETFVVRKSKLRVIDMETDLKTNYHTIDPNFYDVFLCDYCGYAALINYFNQITDKQKELVREKVSPQFTNWEYHVPLTPEDTLQRYKMALLCAAVTGAKAGQKAILCLKAAWVCRGIGDKANEKLFIKNALKGFKEAYKTEDFPIGAMNEPTVKYLIGELLRRSGELSEAMKWISEVITAKTTNHKLKERAMLVKDLIRERNTD